MDQGERTLNMDLPDAVATAAEEGNVDAVKAWLAAGGAPDAVSPRRGYTLLTHASVSSRPSCAAVAELLCAAGARDVGGRGEGMCLGFAAFHGALDTVRVLLRYGSPVNAIMQNGSTALHQSVMAYEWSAYQDSYSIANARAAASMGHQGIVRLLLKHGAAVNTGTTKSHTPLMTTARFSGFISLGVVRELLAGGADLDMVNYADLTADAIGRSRLQKAIYNGEGIPENPRHRRRPGAVEAFLALLAEVRAAGSWKRYANAPRVQLVVLRKLTERGRATVPRYHFVLTHLFARRTLPDVIFWKILSFWRTDRDPPSC